MWQHTLVDLEVNKDVKRPSNAAKKSTQGGGMGGRTGQQNITLGPLFKQDRVCATALATNRRRHFQFKESGHMGYIVKVEH